MFLFLDSYSPAHELSSVRVQASPSHPWSLCTQNVRDFVLA